MTDNLFPGRSALAVMSGASEDWVEGYRKGFQFGTVDAEAAMIMFEAACQASVAVIAGGVALTPQGWKDLEMRNRAALDRLEGLRDGFEAGRGR